MMTLWLGVCVFTSVFVSHHLLTDLASQFSKQLPRLVCSLQWRHSCCLVVGVIFPRLEASRGDFWQCLPRNWLPRPGSTCFWECHVWNVRPIQFNLSTYCQHWKQTDISNLNINLRNYGFLGRFCLRPKNCNLNGPLGHFPRKWQLIHRMLRVLLQLLLLLLLMSYFYPIQTPPQDRVWATNSHLYIHTWRPGLWREVGGIHV